MTMSPQTIQIILSVSLGLSVLLLGLAGAGLIRQRDPARRRLESLVGGARPGAGAERSVGLGHLLGSMFARLAKLARSSEDRQETKLRKVLVAAGFRSPQAVNVFLGLKVACAGAGPLVLSLTPLADRFEGPMWLGMLLGAAGIGLILPSRILDEIGRRRRERIAKELPDVLDLLVISVEAGLGLDAAVQRVAKELHYSSPILAEELTLMGLELRAGIPREKALRNLAERCDVEEVSGLVSMLNQADRFGVSIGRSIRIQSDTVRTTRRQKLEEKAAKIPLKLLFPVLFMIFPAIIIVISGPALLRVMESIME